MNKAKKRKRGMRRVLFTLIGLLCVVVLVGAIGLAMAWKQLGKNTHGERLNKMKRSPNYADGKFHNPIPTDNSLGPGKLWKTLKLYLDRQRRVPDQALPITNLSEESFATPPASGLRVTWLGHSSVLLEIEGSVVLFDPVFSNRVSPLPMFGPKRFHPVPVSISDLPHINAVVISHDHFDHLDYETLMQLEPKTSMFYVPLGVGAHLEYWKIPPDKIIEMDWWEEKRVSGDIRLIACPARHFSGRYRFGDRTLWVSWALIGPSHRIFFSGDTGIMPLFNEVGEQFGPFDATFIKIGAYGKTWHDIHVDPEEAVEVHRMVKGRLMIPIHWGTFNLSYHGWKEPVERLLVASENSGVNVAVPKPGQCVEPIQPPPVERWWAEFE
jgi:L-ascorbate metabolism protein UlaG (beta-lactamase superfamily)